MKEVCRAILNGSWKGWSIPHLAEPQELRDVAESFARLQEVRHQADYDNHKNWTRTEALAILGKARTAFKNWAKIESSPVAEEFLLSLTIGKKRE